MKITFEGESLTVIQMEIVDFIVAAMPGSIEQATAILADRSGSVQQASAPAPKPEPQKAKGPKNKGGRPKGFKVKPKPVEKSADKVVEKLAEKAGEKPVELDDLVLENEEQEPVGPAQLTAIRVKTTEDLQAAYSSGKHKQVLDLLAKFGNGAKSFRELQIRDFIPIRKAIDDGALT